MDILVLSPAGKKTQGYAKIVTEHFAGQSHAVARRCFNSFERHCVVQAKLLVLLLPALGYLSGKIDTQEFQKCFDHGNLLAGKPGYSLLVGQGIFKNRASLRFMAVLEEKGVFLLGSAVVNNVSSLKKEINSWNLVKNIKSLT